MAPSEIRFPNLPLPEIETRLKARPEPVLFLRMGSYNEVIDLNETNRSGGPRAGTLNPQTRFKQRFLEAVRDKTVYGRDELDQFTRSQIQTLAWLAKDRASRAPEA
eukprot:5791047-Pyramimonas_sp.AAC.1